MPVRLPIVVIHDLPGLYEFFKIDPRSLERLDQLQERIYQSHQLVVTVTSQRIELGVMERFERVMSFPFDNYDLVAAMDDMAARHDN